MDAKSGLVPLWGPRACPSNDGVLYAASFVRGLCGTLESYGHDALAFLERAELSPQRLTKKDGWLSLAEVEALVREAVATTGDPSFGLHWGERTTIELDRGPISLARAPSLREALDAIVQKQFAFVNRAQLFYIEEGSRSRVELELLTLSEPSARVVTELWLVCLLRCLRRLGHGRAIRRINVAWPRPASAAEYERVLGSKLRFDRPRTAIDFASAALDRRPDAGGVPSSRRLSTRGELLSHLATREPGTALQLEALVRSALPRAPGIVEAARSLGLTPRALRARLRDEALCFSDVVDYVQRQRAMELLASDELTVKEVARATGFRSPSGFQRAFRRWTGESPGRSRLSALQPQATVDQPADESEKYRMPVSCSD